MSPVILFFDICNDTVSLHKLGFLSSLNFHQFPSKLFKQKRQLLLQLDADSSGEDSKNTENYSARRGHYPTNMELCTMLNQLRTKNSGTQEISRTTSDASLSGHDGDHVKFSSACQVHALYFYVEILRSTSMSQRTHFLFFCRT